MPAQRLTNNKRPPLVIHLSAILILKAVALYLIWLAWFSQPPALGPQEVTNSLLTTASVSICSPKEPCDATHP